MFRIPAAQFQDQIGCDLDWPMVRGQQVKNQRHRSSGDGGCFAHPEEVLQTGSNRGRPSFVVFDFGAPAAWQGEVSWRDFIQQAHWQHGLESGE